MYDIDGLMTYLAKENFDKIGDFYDPPLDIPSTTPLNFQFVKKKKQGTMKLGDIKSIIESEFKNGSTGRNSFMHRKIG